MARKRQRLVQFKSNMEFTFVATWVPTLKRWVIPDPWCGQSEAWLLTEKELAFNCFMASN